MSGGRLRPRCNEENPGETHVELVCTPRAKPIRPARREIRQRVFTLVRDRGDNDGLASVADDERFQCGRGRVTDGGPVVTVQVTTAATWSPTGPL
jgi:hypothetical protein